MVLRLNSCLAEALPYVAQVTLETLLVALTTLGKAAMSKGMNRYAFVFYSNVLSTLIFIPLSFIIQRKKRLPPVTFSLLVKFFFISLIGITINQTCVYAGIDYSSPTLLSAMRNLIPVFTFLLAVIFRMEKLNLKSSKSQIKIIGTLVSIAGALTVTLYKGSPIGFSGDKSSLKNFSQSPNLVSTLLATKNDWAIGGILNAISSLCIAFWIISQGAIIKEYPDEVTIVAYYFLFGSIQCAAVSLVAERYQQNAWTLRPDIELISVICSALVGGVLILLVDIWCINKKGPVFVGMFKPLGIAIAAIMGIFLGETLHVGTIIGSIIVMIGFYGVMWAKSKENEELRNSKNDTLPSSSSVETPLLQN